MAQLFISFLALGEIQFQLGRTLTLHEANIWYYQKIGRNPGTTYVDSNY